MTRTPRVSNPVSVRCAARQAAQEQRGRDQRDERQRNLRDDQRLPQREETAQAAMPRASGNDLVLEHRNDVRLR